MKPDVTVLIPLHRSLRFIEVLRQNIRELSPTTRIIVSDPFEHDIAFHLLKTECVGNPNVTFIGRRDLEASWVPHYNDLLSRVRTTFFMWLAHDDEVDASYISICRGHLLTNSELGGVVGEIASVEGEHLHFVPQLSFPDEKTNSSYQFLANALLFEWNLGILFRAVFRTKRAKQIPITFQKDHWADLVWAYGFCVENHVVQDPTAVYRKRFFPESTHAGWDPRTHLASSLPYFVEQIVTSRLRKKRRLACESELLLGISEKLIAQLN